MSHRSKEYDAMLHDTVALIAYEEPEVRRQAMLAPLSFIFHAMTLYVLSRSYLILFVYFMTFVWFCLSALSLICFLC